MVGPGVAEGALTILASGVDIFFVISGFIIASTAVSRPDPLEFVFRRAVRIYPVYWLVLLAAFVSGYWIALSPEDRPALDLGLIFAWTYPNWYIAPAWSIAFEMHFYAAVAVILAIAPERLFKLLFAALAVVAIAVTFRLPLGIYGHPLTPEFGAGVAIAYLVQRACSPPAGIGSSCGEPSMRSSRACRPTGWAGHASSMPSYRRSSTALDFPTSCNGSATFPTRSTSFTIC
jgi:peptidoglycan/LPS O-acetylase OafA/YrhL